LRGFWIEDRKRYLFLRRIQDFLNRNKNFYQISFSPIFHYFLFIHKHLRYFQTQIILPIILRFLRNQFNGCFLNFLYLYLILLNFFNIFLLKNLLKLQKKFFSFIQTFLNFNLILFYFIFQI
jgi:hypothetical protein